MLRTGKTQQYRREALPIAEDESNSTARLRPVQDTSIIRETDQLLVAPLIFRCIAFRSRALHSQNWPDSLRKPNWTDTPALGFAACCLRFPLLPWNWPSFRYAPAAGSRGILSSRWRDDARQRVQTPRQIGKSFAAPLSCRNGCGLRCSQAARLWPRLAYPDKTQEQLYSKPPLFAVSRWRVTLGKRVPAVSRVPLAPTARFIEI